MIFDYNPITGLNYYSVAEETYLIEYIPYMAQKSTQEILDEWKRMIRETGIQIVNYKDHKPNIEILSPGIFSNVPYQLDVILEKRS